MNTTRNTLAQEADLPPLIALCENEERQRMMFEEEFEPIFPIGKIKEDVFWRLIADNNMSSVILLRDGHVQQIWDEKIPDKDEIKEALSKSRRANLRPKSGETRGFHEKIIRYWQHYDPKLRRDIKISY